MGATISDMESPQTKRVYKFKKIELHAMHKKSPFAYEFLLYKSPYESTNMITLLTEMDYLKKNYPDKYRINDEQVIIPFADLKKLFPNS